MGSFIAIKEMGKEKGGGSKDLLASSEDQQERESRNGRSLSLKETFCACVQTKAP